MARKELTVLLDPQFRKFLEHIKTKYGVPISRTVEIATLEVYQDEYNDFLKQNTNGGENQ